jgi:transcriptional regulator with XRE-family HTH domain
LEPSPFGQYLKKKRNEAEMSLRAVAEALDVSHVYLGEIERGRRRILPEKHWADLIKAVPGITKRELEKHATESAPIDLVDVQGPARDVVVALARRLDSQDLTKREIKQLLGVLERRA